MQVENAQINPTQVLARALSLTGSISNLSRLSGINRGTLLNVYRQKYKINAATILRLKDFVDQNENRAGRPFKKQENFKKNEFSV